MPKKMRKDAIPTGLSLSRDIFEKTHEYHSKLTVIYLKRTGKVPSFSDTLELLIRAGYEVMQELDFDEVIESLRKRETPEAVLVRARQRKASILGGLRDEDVDKLIKKAGRMK
ncbi:hypothetical protein ES703_00078 [subsurface metagenome]